jgi:hypothetical protein
MITASQKPHFLRVKFCGAGLQRRLAARSPALLAVIEGNAGSSSSSPTPSSHPANRSNSGWRRARSRKELQSTRRGTGGDGYGSSDSAKSCAARPVGPLLAARRDLPVAVLLGDWDLLGDWGSLAESPMGDSRPFRLCVPPVRRPHWIRQRIRRFPDFLPLLAQIRKSPRQDTASLLRQPR